jgi:hypothetical protein
MRDFFASAFHDDIDNVSFKTKVLAAVTTGTLGSIIANPIDVISKSFSYSHNYKLI